MTKIFLTDKRLNQGFTLIEVLIAMAIFAVLAVVAYGGLQQTIINREETQASLQRLKELQLTMSNVQRDFSQLSLRNIRDETGSERASLLAGQGNDLLVELSRNGWRNPAKTSRGNLQRVAYRLDEDKLIRIYWPFADRALDDQAVETILIGNIKDVKLRFLDQGDEWHDSWPALNANPDDPASLPRAVEFTLQMEDWGDMVRIIGTTE